MHLNLHFNSGLLGSTSQCVKDSLDWFVPIYSFRNRNVSLLVLISFADFCCCFALVLFVCFVLCSLTQIFRSQRCLYQSIQNQACQKLIYIRWKCEGIPLGVGLIFKVFLSTIKINQLDGYSPNSSMKLGIVSILFYSPQPWAQGPSVLFSDGGLTQHVQGPPMVLSLAARERQAPNQRNGHQIIHSRCHTMLPVPNHIANSMLQYQFF